MKYFRIIPLCLFILIVLSIPKEAASSIRNLAIASTVPAWNLLNKSRADENQIESLLIENHALKQKMVQMGNWIAQNEHLEQELHQLIAMKENTADSFTQRREKYLSQILNKQIHCLPARVIFREPSNWSSIVWVNVGEKDNQSIGEKVIAINSPVVVGKAVVGVVETVLENRSSIRLITDQTCSPSVRVARGGIQNRILADQLATLIKTLTEREDLHGAKDIAHALACFRDQLDVNKRDSYLAKGQLQGTSRPLWRMLGQKLKGTGFNYNFGDEEGIGCDLRSSNQPLIAVGDVLITSGLDGIFPPDLQVATVTKILPLQEGHCSYSLEAYPIISSLNTLTEVFILPPQ